MDLTEEKIQGLVDRIRRSGETLKTVRDQARRCAIALDALKVAIAEAHSRGLIE